MTRSPIDSSKPETWVHLRNDPDLRAASEVSSTEDDGPETPAASDPIATLTKHWKRDYERAARRQERKLLADHQGAGASERVVLAAAAKDFAVSDSLWRSVVQLSARVEALVDNPRHVVALARALKEVIACRSATTTRAEQLLAAASTLRAQRRVANPEGKPSLRRVV